MRPHRRLLTVSVNPDSPHTSDPSRVIEAIVGPLVADLGYELLLVEWIGKSGRRILRIYLDKLASDTQNEGSSISLDDCTRMGRIVGNALDATEAVSGEGAGNEGSGLDAVLSEVDSTLAGAVRAVLAVPYTLEVSSPGLERPLAKLSHFSRFCGRQVKIRTWDPVDSGSKQKTIHGYIEAAEADPEAKDDPTRGVVVIRELDSPGSRRLSISQIRRANLVFEG